MKVLKILVFFVSLNPVVYNQTGSNWFEKESMFSTVLLERELNGTCIHHGTGFVINPYFSKVPIIITCEHVLKNSSIFITLEVDSIFRNYVRSLSQFNQREVLKKLNNNNTIWNISDNYLRVKIDLIKDSTLYRHPDGLDIAAFKTYIPGKFSTKDSIYKITNVVQIGISRIAGRNNIKLGDDSYFIGFPFGIGSPKSVFSNNRYFTSTPKHLLRKGTIAWLSDDYDEFLLDAMSYGGNSGSPLFQINSNNKDKPPYYLIGIVIGHLEDTLSRQNHGLAKCLSSDEIMKVIKLADH